MLEPAPFPIRVEDLTPEFLSAALGRTVTSFRLERVGADRGMLGEIFRLDLDSTDPLVPATIVAKFAALRDGSLASGLRGRNYERELRCYDELLSRTPTATPACHGTWYDPDTAHFLLLQDLAAADQRIDQIDGLTVEQARTVLTQVAQLHARWWGDESLTTLDWLPRLDAELRVNNLTTLARVGWDPLVELIGDQLPAVPNGFGEQLPDRIETALRSVAVLPHTLIHSDLRADNLLFDPADGSVTIIDWQGCGIGPGGFDVSYFVVQSLTVEDRRAHEADLVEHWRTELAAAGIDASAADAGYAESIWFAVAVACAIPVIGDPGEPRVQTLTATVVSRTIAALADHGEL